MSHLLARVAYGHLLDVRPYAVAFDVVGMEQVVAEVILREVERDEEACVVWRQPRRSNECDCELGTRSAISEYAMCSTRGAVIQVYLLAAEGDDLLRDRYGLHCR